MTIHNSQFTICQYCQQPCFTPLPPIPTIRRAYQSRGVTAMATCAGGRAAEKKLLGYSYDDVEEAKMNAEARLDQILKDSPADVQGQKWAIFGRDCLWWATDLADCGRSGWLPRCPHCDGLLDQAPLGRFIEAAKNNPNAYGEHGLAALLAAYHKQAETCRTNWNRYRIVNS